VAVTEIVPDVDPKVTLMLFVELLPEEPDGRVHEYPVIPELVVYVYVEPGQTEVVPEIDSTGN
jgi:hypothetical protein